MVMASGFSRKAVSHVAQRDEFAEDSQLNGFPEEPGRYRRLASKTKRGLKSALDARVSLKPSYLTAT
jgi:hypothetical protein